MRRLSWVVAVAVVAAACAADEEQQIEPVDDVVQQPTAAPPSAPDTTAEALWAHLQDADYRSWPMFPGKGELYSGTEPHGMLLSTYVNRIGGDALTNGASTLPDGAIIVKENYMPDSTFAAATVMHSSSRHECGPCSLRLDGCRSQAHVPSGYGYRANRRACESVPEIEEEVDDR